MSDEGGHWYTRQGDPCYEINGRGVNLRDARKMALVPSVTTVMNIMAKPALVNWLIEQAVMAALTLPRRDGEIEAAYLARIKEDGKAQAKAAADEGSRIHDACEKIVKGESFDETYRLHAEAAVAELHRLFPDVNDWIAEKSFAHPSGFGGKVDLHSPSTGIVVDFKSKDGDFTELDAYGKPKKLAWDQNIQLAAYQVGLQLMTSPEDLGGVYGDAIQCANIFVSRTHPGAVASHVWTPEEVAEGWNKFEAALRLWKTVRSYDASY